MTNLERRPRRSDGVLSQRAADTTVLLDPVSGEYFALDEVGAGIWALCDGSRSVGDIAAAMSEEYDASPDEIRADLLALLAELESSGLVDFDARA